MPSLLKGLEAAYMALNIETKEIVGFYVGECSRNGAMLRAAYGILTWTISTVRSLCVVIPSSGLPMIRSFPSQGIEQLVKTVEKLT